MGPSWLFQTVLQPEISRKEIYLVLFETIAAPPTLKSISELASKFHYMCQFQSTKKAL